MSQKEFRNDVEEHFLSSSIATKFHGGCYGLHTGANKRRWVSFFNPECADQLRECLEGRKPDERLFPIGGDPSLAEKEENTYLAEKEEKKEGGENNRRRGIR